MEATCRQKNSCRVCLSNNVEEILNLGEMPPANAFLPKEKLKEPENSFPLRWTLCEKCGFVGLGDIVSPELLFKDYVYVSSTSPSFVRHFEEMAGYLSQKLNLQKNDLIVDIGSNDGILLRPYKTAGFRVMGIDPAEKIAEAATKSGIQTIPKFFTTKLAKQILEENGTAKLITATSVFPHIDDLDEIISGVKTVLASDGLFVVEAYYLKSIIEDNLFDTIYHEHLSYFTVDSASKLLERLGMELVDVEITDTHGGSLRLFSQIKGGSHKKNNENIEKFLEEETAAGMKNKNLLIDFSNKIEKNKIELIKLIKELKSNNKRIAAYGAPAKGNTLLNYFKLGQKEIDYIIDDNPLKQGLFTPGTKIQVFGGEKMKELMPDYLLILAWNFAKPIIAKNAYFQEKGGKFIIPVPTPTII